jgi:DNA-directed RNA polymerase subunit RPC12/RpoP
LKADRKEIKMAEKKIGNKVAKTPAAAPVKLNDNEIEKVSGGFVEHEGYANGHTIACPYCGNQYEGNFSWWLEDGVCQNGYTCQVCGASFWVDEGGFYYDGCDNMMPFGSFD